MPVRRLPAGAGNRRRQHETPKCAALPKPQVDDADAAEEFAGSWGVANSVDSATDGRTSVS
jgi:hypothetical protein